MELIINIEYIINLILLLLFHMHMFQLNSYFFMKHIRWIKTNIKKIITQLLLVGIPTALLIFNNTIANILSAILLAISIFYNFPKTKSKISLKITNRVKRMFITEFLIISLILIIGRNYNANLFTLSLLNILSPILCIIANFINSPIERIGKQHYIDQAKKILNGMPNLIVIGVTGSYGKTSVKNFLVKTLSQKYEVLTTPQNYNTTMGVVKTLRENLKPTHQIFICEMGATKVGDIKEICDIVKPKFGVITSIGPQHLESFKSIDNIVKTKFELADSVKENGGIVFLNYSNEYLAKQKSDYNIISYGINDNTLSYNAFDLNSSSKGLSFKMIDNSSRQEVEFQTKLIGKHNIINLSAAIAIANHLGIALEKLVPAIRNIKSVEHRLQLISHGELTIIDDSYNSNPISSKSALDTLAEFEGVKIVVTPGLVELGNDGKKYNFELGQNIADVCDYIFLVGTEYSKDISDGIASKGFDNNKVFNVSSPQEAMNRISSLGINDKITVLLENDLPDNYNL